MRRSMVSTEAVRSAGVAVTAQVAEPEACKLYQRFSEGEDAALFEGEFNIAGEMLTFVKTEKHAFVFFAEYALNEDGTESDEVDLFMVNVFTL